MRALKELKRLRAYIGWTKPMSQLDHLQTFGEPNQGCPLYPKADICVARRHVR
jgi:hypothetical protein